MTKLRYFALLCAALLVGNGCSSSVPGLTLADLEGSWTPVELNEDGKAIPEARMKRIEFIFEQGKYNRGESSGGGGGAMASVSAVGMHSVSLDSRIIPTPIDLVMLETDKLGKVQPGLIQKDGNRLKICLGPLDGERPKDFGPGPKITYAILEKKQK